MVKKGRRERGKQTEWKREGRKKKLCNLLLASLIEPPLHFSRGWSAGRLDGLIRMHAHTRGTERPSYARTQIGNASHKLSSVVFFDKFD